MHACVVVADEGEIYALLDRFAKYDGEEKPEGRWDYFGIGGLFEGALPLKQPKKVRRFFGLLPGGTTSKATIAKKSEVDCARFLADPPPGIYFRGKLHMCPFLPDDPAFDRWPEDFRRVFAQIPEDTILRIIDAHS